MSALFVLKFLHSAIREFYLISFHIVWLPPFNSANILTCTIFHLMQCVDFIVGIITNKLKEKNNNNTQQANVERKIWMEKRQLDLLLNVIIIIYHWMVISYIRIYNNIISYKTLRQFLLYYIIEKVRTEQ